MTTSNLILGEMTASQFQKEITFNEALQLIDAVLGNGIIARQAAPPGSPAEGDCYIVIGTATGEWLSQESTIAQYLNGAWIFYTPSTGWTTYCAGDSQDLIYNGTAWGVSSGMVMGPETDTFVQVLKFRRGATVTGCVDNSGTNLRLKALNNNDIYIINDANVGLSVLDSGTIRQDLPTSAVLDADVAINQVAMWLDSVGGLLMVKVNDGGTIKSGSIVLT